MKLCQGQDLATEILSMGMVRGSAASITMSIGYQLHMTYIYTVMTYIYVVKIFVNVDLRAQPCLVWYS